MSAARYLKAFAASLALWLVLFLAITWSVDPYRVSPWSREVEGWNRYKPKRKDIDRMLKPFEVWTKKPRTVFLGTSRIHQAMDPAVLDGTMFAPAYNASIPASSLQLNTSHLRKYLRIDPELKNVIVELMFYNFIAENSDTGRDGWLDFLSDASALVLSSDAFWASVQTAYYNAEVNAPCREIQPRGYIDYPERRHYSPTNDVYGGFLNFATTKGIWAPHAHGKLIQPSGRFELQESAFQAVAEMVRLCKERGVRLLFVITPAHAMDDYYLDTFGGLDLKIEWLERLTTMAEVYSCPLLFEAVYEPIRLGMRYWYDPMHFSLETGRQMLHSFRYLETGLSESVVRLAPHMARPYIEKHQSTVREWAAQNPWFTAAMEAGRQEFEAEKRRSGR